MANEQKELMNKLINATMGAALVYTAVRLLGLIYQIILMRLLGSRGMGYYSVASEVYNLLALICAGCVPMALVSATSPYIVKKEYKNATMIYKSAKKYASIMGIFFAVIVFAAAPWLANLAFSTQDMSIVLRFMAPALFISALVNVYRGLYESRSSMVPTVVSQVIEQAVCIIAGMIAAAVMTGKGLAMGAAGGMLGLCIGSLAAYIFCFLLNRSYQTVLRRQDKTDRESKRISKDAALKKFLSVMLPIALCQIAFELEEITYAVLFNKVLVFVAYPEDVRIEMFGIYTGQYRVIINILLALLMCIAMVKAPELKKLHKKKKIEELNIKAEWMIRLAMTIAIPASVFIALMAEPIIQIVFNDINELPMNLLMVGAPAAAFYAMASTTNIILQNVWRRKVVAINSFIALVLDGAVVGILLILTDMNVYALIYGSYVFTVVSSLLNLRSMNKYLGYKQRYTKSMISPLLAALVMGIAAWIIYNGVVVITRSETLGLILALVAALFFYVFASIVFGVFEEEEILKLPMGDKVVLICKKIHIL